MAFTRYVGSVNSFKIERTVDQRTFLRPNIPAELELYLTASTNLSYNFQLTLSIVDANGISLIAHETIYLSYNGLLESDEPREVNTFHMKEENMV